VFGSIRRMNSLFRRTLAIGLLLAFAGLGVANAITIDSSRLLGTVNPASPSSASDQLNYINTLVGRYNAGSGDGSVAGHFYDVSPGATVPAAPLPLASAMGGNIGASGTSLSVNLTGGDWLLAKVGDTAAVYYVAGLTGTHTLVNNVLTNENGQFQDFSHYVLSTTSVPDGDAATAMILGSVLLVLAYVRNRTRLI
jgi:hypothetical protein